MAKINNTAMKELIIDTETTGLIQGKDRVIELAIVEFKFNRLIKKVYHSYFNPENVKVGARALEIHGITNEFLEAWPKFKDEANKILQIINNSKLVAHNVKFDKQMLLHELKISGVCEPEVHWCDTLKLARLLNPRGSNSLRSLCRKYKIRAATNKHNALLDCELLALLYNKLLNVWIQSNNESWFNDTV
ncbi:DNA polymerase III subunit epsilon [Candidatus Hodgkinia cicadicola]|nr:DNA polymerase III subunit epsilon [Candidatus Hodgkinia cicadicola]